MNLQPPTEIHMDITLSPEDIRQICLIQAEYLADGEILDQRIIVAALIQEALITRHLARKADEMIERSKKESNRDYHL